MISAIVNAILGMFSGVGLGGIVLNLVKDAVMAMLMKIQWKVVIERATSRLVVRGLHRLASLSSNTLMMETVDDLVAQIESKGLPKAGNAHTAARNRS